MKKKFAIIIERSDTIEFAKKLNHYTQQTETKMFSTYESANSYAAENFNSWSVLECVERTFDNRDFLQAFNLR